MTAKTAIYIILAYFASINIVGGCMFGYDKYAATHKRPRIPESRLHTLELLGSVFAIVPLMYLIRHKNRKAKYYLLTYLVLLAWIALITWLSVTFWNRL